MATRTEQAMNLISEVLSEKDQEIEQLQKYVSNGASEMADLESKIEDLEVEVENGKPKTLYGEQKVEILKKMRHLPLATLEKLEEEYCKGILGHEPVTD